MARYEHLPIYKQAMDLSVYFEKTVRDFSSDRLYCEEDIPAIKQVK